MAIYTTCGMYVASATNAQEKIVKIDAIIAVLEETALKGAGQNDLMQYTLDDGQTKIITIYRDMASTVKAINDFLALKQIYINQINGRIVRLVDSKNFRR